MSDPNRWLDDDAAPPEVRSLLAAATRTPGIPRADDEALRSAMAGIAAGTVVTPTIGASIAAKIAGAIMLVAIGGGVAWWALHGDSRAAVRATARQPTNAPTVVTSVADGGAPSNPIGARIVPATAVPLAEIAPRIARHVEVGAHQEPSRTAGASDTRGRPDAAVPLESTTVASGAPIIPAAAAPADPLAIEFEYIGRARTLRSTDPTQALSALEAHERLFPSGALAPERDYLMVDVLRRLGRTDDARTRGRLFLQRHAESPYAALVRRTLETL